ncbi:MAG: AraC family transcriptional regulator [Sulfurospirillaceae bacterium]|nr:AraC family transcriptional regulator [Sulfurospirillaceae bacterium]MDD2826993.1 AraC family transcriptional regulator [Sulfurospirillaceae bacterium]
MDLSSKRYKEELIQIILAKRDEEGAMKTAIPSLSFYTTTTNTECIPAIYEPSLCLVLQGAKILLLGGTYYRYDASGYVLSSTHMPTRVRITEASTKHPFISLKLTFTMEDIFEVMKEAEPKAMNVSVRTPERGLCFGENNTPLLDPLTRLVRLLDTPQNIKFMAPLIMKELLYIVMSDKGGEFLRKYLMDGSSTQQVVKVISKIKNNFAENINIKELAKTFAMSESSLYHNFKKVTLMSPLQFQKTLRLEEARRILLTQDKDATEIAFAVGYESPSQFSREYTRMFGLPPKAYAKAVHNNPEEVA